MTDWVERMLEAQGWANTMREVTRWRAEPPFALIGISPYPDEWPDTVRGPYRTLAGLRRGLSAAPRRYEWHLAAEGLDGECIEL